MVNNLISLDGLADVGNNLIDKLSSAVGWLATHKTPKKIAVETYIKDIQNSDYEPITKAFLISNANKSIKEYSNQYKIVAGAIKKISPTAQPSSLDNDWLAQFMDKARLVYDEEFQTIWSYLLAEECNENGSVPKALLHVMEQMDRDMANVFMAVASTSIYYIDAGKLEYHPVILWNKLKTYYKNIGITLNNLLDLQSIGLIEIHLGFDGEFGVTFEDSTTTIRYFDQQYLWENSGELRGFGNVVYTKIGQALCKAISPRKIEDFFQTICIPHWQEQEKTINRI